MAGKHSQALQTGVQKKLLRVVSGLLTHTTACVRQGSEFSREFTDSQGVEQGRTLSPILFHVYVDDLLADTWQHCDGVPLELPRGAAGGKLVSLMFADDFARHGRER
jgi:hypothetical protein